MPSIHSMPFPPGRVVRLDTSVLRARGGSRTNAQVTPDEDRAVTGVHDFLVVEVDASTPEVVALPLFPRSAPGSAPLDDRLRSGEAAWVATPVFYSRWQHWRIPLDALAAAEVADSDAAPRHYATDKIDTLRDLANWASRNRCPFRPA